jgi:hypothetical protein
VTLALVLAEPILLPAAIGRIEPRPDRRAAGRRTSLSGKSVVSAAFAVLCAARSRLGQDA